MRSRGKGGKPHRHWPPRGLLFERPACGERPSDGSAPPSRATTAPDTRPWSHQRREDRPPVYHVDPPDLKLWPTIRHLYPLWRAQWRLAAIGLSCALVFTALSLLI